MSNALLMVLCRDQGRRDAFVGALAEAGWLGVESASSMAEAVGLIRDEKASKVCLVVDAELADMSGPSAVAILRELCPHAKIIFTTPENTRDLEARVRAQSVFYYYISSSAELAELVEAVADAIGSPRPPSRAAGQPAKVLIVDDDRDFHHAVRVFLQSAGFSTISAYSQREGLAAARREKPDAILLDIIMDSTTDGFEFCREAKRDPQIKHTPIVGISAIEQLAGLACRPDSDPGLFPVDSFLAKPTELQRIVGELRRLIPGDERL
jgi:CheY-like chemotaxis protein